MFGFVNSDEEKSQLGGEIFRDTQRMRKITMSTIGVIVFILFNVLMYFLSGM